MTYVRWGGAAPYTLRRYEFQTSAQLEAFLAGVDEASGWMDYHVLERDECASCGHHESEHGVRGCGADEGGCPCRRFARAEVLELADPLPEGPSAFVAELADALAGVGASAVVASDDAGIATLIVVREPGERFVLTVTRAGA